MFLQMNLQLIIKMVLHWVSPCTEAVVAARGRIYQPAILTIPVVVHLQFQIDIVCNSSLDASKLRLSPVTCSMWPSIQTIPLFRVSTLSVTVTLSPARMAPSLKSISASLHRSRLIIFCCSFSSESSKSWC